MSLETSATQATPNGKCYRCGGTTYENLTHHCTSSVAGIPLVVDPNVAPGVVQLRDGFGSVIWEWRQTP